MIGEESRDKIEIKPDRPSQAPHNIEDQARELLIQDES